MQKSKVLPYLEAMFAVMVWGATFIATKIALREASPATIVWMRFGMGTIILGIVVVARKQFALPEKREWLYFLMLGFLGVMFHQWLQATGLQTAKATTTAWIVATTPVFIFENYFKAKTLEESNNLKCLNLISENDVLSCKKKVSEERRALKSLKKIYDILKGS